MHYLTGVQYLFDSINPDQIDIPQLVLDHDAKVTGHFLFLSCERCDPMDGPLPPEQVNGSNYYAPGSKGEEASGGL